MDYDGTLTPGTAQTPGSLNQLASPQQIQMQYALVRALMNNQPQHMQSWLQPLAQAAQTAVAAKYMNAANAAQQANAKIGLPLGPQAAATPAATGGLPTGSTNPISALFGPGIDQTFGVASGS